MKFRVVRFKKTGILFCAVCLLAGSLCSCGVSSSDVLAAPSEPAEKESDAVRISRENPADTSQGSHLSGVVPAELEYIPDGYTSPAEHAGTLNKITYDTWESFTYEQHSQKLTKEAWVEMRFRTVCS